MPVLILSSLLVFLTAITQAQKPFITLNYDGYRDGQGPGIAEPSYEEVEEDIQILAPYTYGIRNYGTPENEHGRWLPELCDKYGLNLHMGVWVDYDSSANRNRLDYAITLANQNGGSIKSIIVGNEYLLRSDAEQHIPRDSSERVIVDYIKYVKENVPSSIKVSTAESIHWWELHSDALWESADEVYVHIYPWWDNVPIENAISYIEEAYNRIKTRLGDLNTPNKKIVVAETGWPTGSEKGPVLGSPENQALYLGTLHSWAKSKNLEYWYFSAFDASWKLQYEPEVGNQWGLWNSDRTPKAVINNLNRVIPEEVWWDNSQLSFNIPKTFKPSQFLTEEKAKYNIFGRRILETSGKHPLLFITRGSLNLNIKP